MPLKSKRSTGRSAIFTELPVAGLLSAQPIRCDPQRGRITVAFQARRDFCNLIGSVQGGMLTAMLDLAMSFSVLCSLDDGHVVPSLEIKTSFIAPARPGEIVGEGMLVRRRGAASPSWKAASPTPTATF